MRRCCGTLGAWRRDCCVRGGRSTWKPAHTASTTERSSGCPCFITRYIKSKNRRRLQKVRSVFRLLISRVEWIVEIARWFCEWSPVGGTIELRRFLPAMRRVVDQARRAQFHGETVPASERVFSIFEPHTELLKRGRRQKPVEFGHMVLLCQSVVPVAGEVHHRLRSLSSSSGRLPVDRSGDRASRGSFRPAVLAADMVFCPDKEKYEELQGRASTLVIPRRMRDLADAVMRTWRSFRAGIEGTISGLKRSFRLARCYDRGFKRFAASLGLGVFSHNLVVLAKQAMT